MIAEASQWAEFGLAGLVIFALFGALGIIVKWLIAHIDKQAETHKQERKEWREANDQSSARSEVAVKELTASIRDLVDKKFQ